PFNTLYVTLWRPKEIMNIVAWLKDSPYRNYAVILTMNDAQSWYFPSYFPAMILQNCVIVSYTEDTEIVNNCLSIGKRRHIGNHYVFVTSDGDRAIQERVEKLIGGEIGSDRLIHTEGRIRVYDISDLLETGNSQEGKNLK